MRGGKRRSWETCRVRMCSLCAALQAVGGALQCVLEDVTPFGTFCTLRLWAFEPRAMCFAITRC